MQKQPVKRNPIAQDLRTAKYAPRIVQSKKVYDRKKMKDE
jgi:hypothetical protein